KLIFTIAICKHREGEKIQPVITWLIEGFQDARLVGIATAPLEQSISFITTVAAKVSVQQVNHGPEVTAFFNVHLKQISQVVKRGTRVAELSLLLHGSRFGITLRD